MINNLFAGFGWTSLIIFFVIGLIALWVSYSFLNKNGFYLLCLLVVALINSTGTAAIFSKPVTMGAVLLPLVFLVLIACYNKFGKSEAIRLFLITIIFQVILFVANLLQSAYLDAMFESRTFMTWEALGASFAGIISFAISCFCTLLFMEHFSFKKLNNGLKNASYIGFACAIQSLTFVVLAYAGILSFGEIFLTWLVCLLVELIISLVLGFFERFLNRQLAFKIVKSENKSKEEKTEKTEEIKTEAPVKAEDNVSSEEKSEGTETSEEDVPNFENSAD